MNYLDFSRKIMLYLQLRGILFEVECYASTDLTVAASVKDGKPFSLSLASENSVDISAINGDGILARIESINERGEVEIDLVDATADILAVEGIEAKVRCLVESVIGNALTMAVTTSAETSVEVSFEPFDALSMRFEMNDANLRVVLTVEAAQAALTTLAVGGKMTPAIMVDIVAGILASFSTGGRVVVATSAINGTGAPIESSVIVKNRIAATLKLLVDALLADYEDQLLEDMSERTLADLKKKII